MPEGEGWGVAVYYENFRGVGGGEGVEIFGEGCDEFPFGTVAVEADVERLGEFETPLGEGAGVDGVEVVVG